MTLILTRASRDFIIQAVDRRIADVQKNIGDHSANKAIIYVCANAAVTIAYTGIAFLDNVATDEWLVEALTGQHIPRDRKPPVFGDPSNKASETLGSAMLRLKSVLRGGEAALAPAARSKWRDHSFDIVAAGWQWNRRGRQRPVVGWITKEAGQNACELGFKNRLWAHPRSEGRPTTLCAAPAGNFSRDEIEQLNARLQDQPVGTVADTLVTDIRRVSASNHYVGPDVLTVAISPPARGEIVVTDYPVSPRYHTVHSSFVGDLRVAVTLMPWIIAPGLVRPPSLLSHTRTLSAGPYEVYLQDPAHPSNVIFEGSLPRLRSRR